MDNTIKIISEILIRDELIRLQRLNELPNLDKLEIKQYIYENYRASINEMSRINAKEFYGYFPYNKFDIKIWSNDHNPPHFHVIGDGWDIVVDIETGTILKTKREGKSSKFYKYVEDYIEEWLESPSAINKKQTNRETAMLAWEMNNG